MKHILIAALISLSMAQANAMSLQDIKDQQRQIDMARVAEATLDAYDEDGPTVYELCEPKYLEKHLVIADESYANSLIESCERLNFRY